MATVTWNTISIQHVINRHTIRLKQVQQPMIYLQRLFDLCDPYDTYAFSQLTLGTSSVLYMKFCVKFDCRWYASRSYVTHANFIDMFWIPFPPKPLVKLQNTWIRRNSYEMHMKLDWISNETTLVQVCGVCRFSCFLSLKNFIWALMRRISQALDCIFSRNISSTCRLTL